MRVDTGDSGGFSRVYGFSVDMNRGFTKGFLAAFYSVLEVSGAYFGLS